MKILNNTLIKKSLILSSPGFLSIIISLVSIPVHLNIAGAENYANYIIFHFLLIFTNLFNLGIGKSIVISMNNFPIKKKQIAYQGLKYTFYIFSLIILFKIFYYLFLYKTNIQWTIFEIDFLLLIIGSIFTLWFLTFEGIFQGNEKFELLSFYNFLFYSVSLSLPSILLIINSNFSSIDLIKITLLIKLFTILIMLINIFGKKLLIKSNSNILFQNLKENSKWISLNLILIQFYDIFDKFIVKFFLGPIALTTYSIPQQLTGKLSILSKGFSAYLLPKLSKKQNHINDFNLSINIFLIYISLLIFIIFPLYENLLSFWLGKQLNENIISLTKVFSISVIYACVSHILITEFEAKKKLQKNTKIEILILPFFLIILFHLSSSNYPLIYISILILFKEWLLLIIRLLILRKNVSSLRFYLILTIVFNLMLYLSIIDNNLFYILLVLLITFILKVKNV